MDDSSKDPVKKSLPTIRHLLATSIDEIEKKKQSSRRLIRRSGPFKWRRGRTKTTEEKGLKTMPADHFTESGSSEEIDFDEFSDALSHTHTEACSLSMVSEINSVDDDDGSIHADTRSFIMDRFLPAAKAMAASDSSAQRARFLRPPEKERRAGMGRTGSRSAGPLPLQSRPYVVPKRNSALPDTDEEEDDDRLPIKMACGSFFAWHLKNAFAHVVHPPLSARKKSTDRRGLYGDDEDEDSSSGTDIIDERAIIAAARKKAWEARYRKNNGLATSSPSPVAKSNDLRDSSSPLMDRTSYNSDSRSQSPLTKIDRELSSPYRNNRLMSPDFNQPDKGFLGFPSDRRPNNSKTKAEDPGVQNPAASSNVNSFTDSNEVEQEDWYSGNSSPSPEISENSDSVTMEKGSQHDHNVIAEENGGLPVVSVLPPPLPKSPTESWLWRAMPLVTASNSMNSPLNRGLGRAIKTHPDELDAKWEAI